MTLERTWLGHQCGVATTLAETDACELVLEAVRVQELRRGTEGSSLESHAFDGAEVESYLIFVRSAEADEIVGCLRITPADDLASVKSSRAEYRIDLVPSEHLSSVAVLTRLAVLPEHRGSLASLAIITEMLAFGLEQGFTAALLACEPGLLGLYVALGAKPIGAARRSPTGGFRVPMMCIADADKLEAAGSPLAEPIRSMPGWERSAPLQQWYERFVGSTGVIETGVRPFDRDSDGDAHASLTEGMSSAGIKALLKHAQVVTCVAGDQVLAADDGSTFVGVVSSGAVEINGEGQTLALLGEGELFGEMAFIRGAPRSADVLALSNDTEVVLLSQKAIDRIVDPLDQATIWRNLARCIAERLAARGSVI
jgi:hypothetical protein